MPSPMVHMIPLGFTVLLGVGAWFDLRARRVPNALVLVLVLSGIVVDTLRTPGGLPWFAVYGMVVGLCCWLPWWLMGMLGAGDVKYFAASASWVGPALAWRATLVAALLGGAWSVWIMRRNAAASRLQTPPTGRGALTVPYAVPMAVSLCLARVHPEWFAVL